ncbi:MAG: hypothetical protein JNM60_00510 [Candidatus Competibacteraceae bacterium]|nr:hypothetical protein [Candidatus Competibacteraceae bacterium]
MNMQLQRKQIIIVGLAMTLAVASYWIPMPQRSLSLEGERSLSKPVELSKMANSIAFAREPSMTQRFLVADQLIQAGPLPSGPVAGDAPKVADPASAQRHFLKPQELENAGSARLDNMLLVPVRNLDQPKKR